MGSITPQLLEKLKAATKDNVPVFSLEGLTLPAKVVGLYDADSPTIAIPVFDQLFQFKTRLLGVDTLEMRTPSYVPEDKKDEYKKNAHRAKNYVLSQVAGCATEDCRQYTKKEVEELLNKSDRLVMVKIDSWDKYGRALIHMYVTGNEKSISEQLIENKLAYAYDGGTKDKTATSF